MVYAYKTQDIASCKTLVTCSVFVLYEIKMANQKQNRVIKSPEVCQGIILLKSGSLSPKYKEGTILDSP